MTPNKDEGKQQGSKDSGSSGQQQLQSGEGKQYGEGNYEASRKYNEGLKDHVQNHDIEKEARDAAPRSAAEEKEMEDAEREGASRAKGDSSQTEGNGMDKPESDPK